MTSASATDSPASGARRDSSLSTALGGKGWAAATAILVILAAGNLLGAALVFAWRAITGTAWGELGFVSPKSWAMDVIAGITGGLLLKLFTKAIVQPLMGIDPVNHTYHFMSGNTAAMAQTLAFVIVGGGFGEEMIFRGFLFERLKKFLGTTARSALIIVLVTSLVFAAAHLHDQGWAGAAQASITGLAFGIAYMKLRRIWPVMIAHASYDVLAVLLIYWNLEVPVARLFLR